MKPGLPASISRPSLITQWILTTPSPRRFTESSPREVLFPGTAWDGGFRIVPAICGPRLLSVRDFQHSVCENSTKSHLQPLNTPEATAVGGSARYPPTPRYFCNLPSHHPADCPYPPRRPSPPLLESSHILPRQAGRSWWPKRGDIPSMQLYPQEKHSKLLVAPYQFDNTKPPAPCFHDPSGEQRWSPVLGDSLQSPYFPVQHGIPHFVW